MGTLFVAEILICTVFALVLFVLANRFPQLRGPKTTGYAFLVTACGVSLLLLRGHMPLVVNVIVANGLLMGKNLLLYSGIAGLLAIRPRLRFPSLVAAVTLPAMAYFTVWHNDINIRIVLVALCNCLMHLNFVVDLFRYRTRSLVVRALAVSILLSMLLDVFRAIATAVVGSPADYFQYNIVQTTYIVTGIFFACALGVFSMALVAREITTSIERSARRDPLTGALNRFGIEELLSVEMERSHRTHVPLSLALLDIDQFKVFNDSGGHAAGDEVLRNVVTCITRHLRPFDACGRIGGDEFLVLLPGSGAPDMAAICDRILREVAALPPHAASGIAPTVSIGFTEADAFDTATNLLARADHALYAAKNQGRNRAQMDLAPIRTLPPEPPTATKPGRRSNLRKAASSMRGFRS